MSVQTADFPVRDDLVDTARKITDRWRIWLRDLRDDVDNRSALLASVTQDGQTGSIVSTPFLTDTLVGGLYRVSAFLHVTTVGSVTSSILVTFSFTHKAVACSISTTALTSNLTTSVQAQEFPIVVDPGTPVSWSTTYAANAAASMAYSVTTALSTVNI